MNGAGANRHRRGAGSGGPMIVNRLIAVLLAAAAAAWAAVDIVRDEPHRRQELLARAAALREDLAGQGWNVGNSASQIIPLLVGEPDRAVRLAAALCERALFIPAIRPPTVPEGEACLRISLTHGHTPEMIRQLLDSLREVAGTI